MEPLAKPTAILYLETQEKRCKPRTQCEVTEYASDSLERGMDLKEKLGKEGGKGAYSEESGW
jgi:hypothetical protein